MKENEYLCAAKALPTQDGLLAIFNLDPAEIKSLLQDENATKYLVNATEYGLEILLPKAELQIPLPTPMFDYLLETPTIVLLFAKAEDYIPQPLCTISLDPEVIKKAKDILVY